MNNSYNHSSKTIKPKAIENDKDMQVLRNLEFVHQRKKAAFDELLRYTYSNVIETDTEREDITGK